MLGCPVYHYSQNSCIAGRTMSHPVHTGWAPCQHASAAIQLRRHRAKTTTLASPSHIRSARSAAVSLRGVLHQLGDHPVEFLGERPAIVAEIDQHTRGMQPTELVRCKRWSSPWFVGQDATHPLPRARVSEVSAGQDPGYVGNVA